MRYYRGKACTERPFSDATGTGTEYLQGGKVVIREHATRKISPEEAAAAATFTQVRKAAEEAAMVREAVHLLAKAEIPKATLDAKVAELKAAAASAVPEAPK